MTQPGDSLNFPDESRSALDKALGEVVTRAQEVLTTQGRLRALLRANQAVVEQLDLPVVLKRIVKAAVELVGAQYGALGVVTPHGDLDQFITVGMGPDLVELIGHLPEGHGLLGALIDDPRPIRLQHLSDDERSAGFPAHHPPMDSFLGVPVKVRDEVFGSPSLTNQTSGQFRHEDEQLVTALAGTAGFAIENARLFAETQSRQAWSAATAEVTAALLSSEQSDPIAVVADRVAALAAADHVRVLLPTDDPTTLLVRVAKGDNADEVEGALIPSAGSIARSVLEGKNPRLVDGSEAGEADLRLSPGQRPGQVIAVPLLAGGRAQGVLVVARARGGARFTPADLDMVADFAGQASLAMELVSARSDRQRILLFEDRTRIARDLHDHVIQQLFAGGLELQSVAGSLPDGVAADRISQVITNLDAAIAQIRTVIFALSSRDGERSASVRHRIIDLATEFGGGLERTPTVTFAGAVDLVVTGALAEDVLAVVREGLANVAKHSEAKNASVTVAVEDGSVSVEIRDDGIGIAPNARRSGLANLESRAVQRGGTFSLDAGQVGTLLRWHIPLSTED